jgi:large subunit ribosomal protein L6
MSRLGKTPVSVPKGVKIKVVGEQVTVEGPKGTLTKPFFKGFTLRVEEDFLFVDSEENVSSPPAFHGLVRALVCNMILGVSKGFEKKLTLIGVGYRATVQGQLIDLQLGFSHPMQLPIPKAVHVVIEKSTSITISGIDKQVVGQFAAEIRGKKPPEPYKGKGIRYENEYVRKKAGKAAKGKAG